MKEIPEYIYLSTININIAKQILLENNIEVLIKPEYTILGGTPANQITPKLYILNDTLYDSAITILKEYFQANITEHE